MSRKIRIGVIYGGRTGEHLVSVSSAASLVSSLDRDKYDVLPIGISREGRWHVAADPARFLETGISSRQLGEFAQVVEARGALEAPNGPKPSIASLASTAGSGVMSDLVSDSIDVAIPLVHGTYGEDGTLQGMLEMAGVPYVGAGVLSSAINMDKIVMKKILGASGIPVGPWLGYRASDLASPEGMERALSETALKLGFPCFVKPANGGSSVGMSRVGAREELEEAIGSALAFDTRVILEQAIDCREIECGAIGNSEPEISLPGEICYESEYYDYTTKYTPGKMKLLAPANLDEATTEKIRSLAREAYRALEVEGMARIDLFLERGTDRLLVNELNTIPGFTSTSVFATLWEISGLPHAVLMDRLIQLAQERHRERRDLQGLKT